MATDTTINSLIINRMTKAQYDALETKANNELYLVPDEIDSMPTAGSTNYVTSGGIYDALQDINQTIEDNEQVIAAALNDLNERAEDVVYFGESDSEASGGSAEVTISVDSSLSSTSENPVQNKAIYAALNSKQNTIDDLSTIRSNAALGATALQSYTETDPVFINSAAYGITSANITNWNSKQDSLTFDSIPTSGSTNPVTSAGIYNVLGDIETLINAL